MRCPNCQHLNAEQSRYCLRCGQELPYFNRYTAPAQPQTQNQYPAPQQGQARPPQPQTQNQYPPQPQAQNRPNSQKQSRNASRTQVQPQQQNKQKNNQPAYPIEIAVEPNTPAAPENFPPRTLDQLKGLISLALPYTVVDDDTASGNKHLIRIAYEHGYAWQQMATLYKAWKDLYEGQWSTIIVQGVDTTGPAIDLYDFTNGRITYNSKVLLGSDIINRYILETDTGLSGSSIRVVLTEPGA